MWLACALTFGCAAPLPAQQMPSSDERPAAGKADTAAQQPSQSAQVRRPAASVPIVVPRTLSSLQGLKVSAIEFRGAAAGDPATLAKEIPQKVDESFDRNKLRSSIQALYSTGRFDDIQVQAERTPQNDVRLVFIARENFFIGTVYIYGAPKPPTANQLLNATKLTLGELFVPEKVEAGIASIRRLLQEHGFYKSSINVSYSRHAETQQIDVIINIKKGEQARVGLVNITGNPGYSEAEIRSIAKIHSNDKVSVARVTRALTRLRKKYQKKKKLEAQVTITNRDYHPETNRLDYTFAVDRGPEVDIKVTGAKLSKGKIQKYIPVYEENAVDNDLLNEGRRNLRDYFQTKGYFDVDIDFRQESPSREQRHVVFTVKKGRKHKLVDLVLDGNKYFDKDTLRERMRVMPATILLANGRFSQTMLTRDAQSIENLYRANGFQQVKVKPEIVDDFRGKSGNMQVIFHIDEGQQTRVASLKIAGNATVSEEQILGMIGTTEGQPYSDFNVASDRDSLVNYYFNRGFPDIKFEALAEPLKDDPTRINLTYRITEGRQQFVESIVVSGLRYTRPYIVDREMQMHPGDPISQTDMLDTQRRLYDLSIFNKVDMAIQNPDGSALQKRILFQTEEGARYTFNYGIGVEVQTGDVTGSNVKVTPTGGGVGGTGTKPNNPLPQGRTGVSPRVSLDITRINFLGRDHTIIFKSRYGRLQQRGLLSYEAPRLRGKENVTLTLTAFYDNTRDVRTFSAERIEGSAQISQQISKATTMLYRYTFRRVRVDASTLQVDPAIIPLLSKPVRVGMPNITYIRDTRDDPIDSRRGRYTTIDFGFAGKAFGSENNFSRLSIQHSSYHAFKRKRWVFARSTRLGIEEPFGRTGDFVPLPERFFAGGGNSHRGFAINQAGPRDLQTGFPIGGSALFLNNLELRTPPLSLPFFNDNISAVIFHDAGNVFANTHDVLHSLLRFSQSNANSCRDLAPAAQCDFNYIAHAIGGGIRYKTPIGPVRIDLGYNLNPPVFPVRSPAASAHAEALKRFNFFFSIGQTF